jgi:zinc transporter ZupT
MWIFVLIGVVGLFVLEHLVFRGGHQPDLRQDNRNHSVEHSDRREHITVGYAVLFGLSIHAFTAGLGLAAVANRPALATSVFLSIISHKGVEGFSLTTVFMLAGFRLRRILLLILGFSLVTPAGVLLGSLVSRQLDGFGVEVMTALAAGTFLFVALCDLLPEVFHRRIDAAIKVLLLFVGVAVSCLIHI